MFLFIVALFVGLIEIYRNYLNYRPNKNINIYQSNALLIIIK